MYAQHQETLEVVQAQLNPAQLSEAAACMLRAERLFVLAFSDAKIAAEGFVNKLAKIDVFATLATENNDEIRLFPFMTARDCALFVTYGNRHPTFERGVEVLRRTGTPIVVLTAREDSALVRAAAHTVLIPDREGVEKIGTFYSQIAFGYVLNLLYAPMFRAHAGSMRVNVPR